MNEFKKHMLKKFRTLGAFTASFLIVLGVGLAIYDAQPLEPTTSRDAMDIRENVPGSPDAVLEEYRAECWTMGDEPKAELPGAAIVQFHDGRTIYTQKHVLVDAAFNEALAAVGYGEKTSDRIEVIALCR